jgi:hypothetical protein|tara:strand:+ start:6185 stop:6517 length:333 start_codon:yes stop_codon:yes gene_type:complete
MSVFADHRNYIPGRLLFPRHFLLYGSLTLLMLIAELIGGNWWRFWPMMIWTMLLSIHYFIASTLAIDEDWAAEKATDVRTRSYDFDHIYNIDKRFKQGHDSVTHPEERKR